MEDQSRDSILQNDTNWIVAWFSLYGISTIFHWDVRILSTTTVFTDKTEKEKVDAKYKNPAIRLWMDNKFQTCGISEINVSKIVYSGTGEIYMKQRCDFAASLFPFKGSDPFWSARYAERYRHFNNIKWKCRRKLLCLRKRKIYTRRWIRHKYTSAQFSLCPLPRKIQRTNFSLSTFRARLWDLILFVCAEYTSLYFAFVPVNASPR